MPTLTIRDIGVAPETVCIVARTRQELDVLARGLTEYGIDTTRLRADSADQSTPGAVRLATMHRVKGLEFRVVILASINAGLVPLPQAVAGSSDVAEQRQADLEERALLYVALTRARERALVLSHGEPSP